MHKLGQPVHCPCLESFYVGSPLAEASQRSCLAWLGAIRPCSCRSYCGCSSVCVLAVLSHNRLGGIPATAASFRRALQKGSVGLVPGEWSGAVMFRVWASCLGLFCSLAAVVCCAAAPATSEAPMLKRAHTKTTPICINTHGTLAFLFAPLLYCLHHRAYACAQVALLRCSCMLKTRRSSSCVTARAL